MTDKTTLPADWAIERALAECVILNFNLADVKHDPRLCRFALTLTLARHIEKHEQPPADPWLLQARELAAEVSKVFCSGLVGWEESYRAGEYDSDPEVQAIAAALRAAYEKGKAA